MGSEGLIGTKTAEIITFDAEDSNSLKERLVAESFGSVTQFDQDDTKDHDLLDLMDSTN